MKGIVFCLITIFVSFQMYGQVCNSPAITFPSSGQNNVPVNSTITWNSVVGVPSYLISIGTTPGGDEIIPQRNVGSALSFTPPLGLPENTMIYVTITLFFFEGGVPDVVCSPVSFRTETVTSLPPCTQMTSPLNGDMDVNISSNISWNYASTATGYRISIGTTSGGSELVNNINVGNVLSYNPIIDFPPSTTIFVRIIPYNNVGDALNCIEESFITGAIAPLPGCTNLISPLNGAINVPLTPLIEWNTVAGADGYRVTIGSSPLSTDVLNNAIFNTTSTLVLDFEPNRTFFVTIIPFNTAGNAIGCIQESFSTVLGCGPYFDPISGELVTLNPEIDFPDTISFCQSETPFLVTSTDIAEGFRWYQIDQFGDETLISETAEVSLTENGEYRYEAYNTVAQSNGTLECPTTKLFNVVSSERATINSVDVTGQSNGIRITINASGIGDYEYALDSANGPYQESNIFDGVEPGSYTVFVRDKNGCGIVEESVEQDLSLEGFPKFFTPNGDGVNDFWQVIPSPITGEINVEAIHIFDRYGQLLALLNPNSIGWDGNFNGSPLPSTDYWFNAITNNNQQIQGHFALKR
ncbi:MAG: T9SS type B sorting domain-containing protein [Eudoraea sp.]